MKWTMNKINKMSVEELHRRIDEAKGIISYYPNGISKRELVNQFVILVNEGKIK